MTPSLVACCLAVRDDPARLDRMKATAERQKTVCGWRFVVVGPGEPETDYAIVIPQVSAGVDRNGGAMLRERAAVKAAPGTVLVTPPEGLTIGSSPAITQEVPNG